MQSVDQRFARELIARVDDQTIPSNQAAELRQALVDMHKADLGDTTVRRAIDLIENHHGGVTVDTVADMTGTSVRRLERLFRASVGLSPKQLCRIARVRRAAGLLTRGLVRWSDVVHTWGYCDQAHFIREFKAIMGVVPPRVLAIEPSP